MTPSISDTAVLTWRRLLACASARSQALAGDGIRTVADRHGFAVVAPDGAVPTVSDESLDVAWYALDALPRQSGVDLQSLVASVR